MSAIYKCGPKTNIQTGNRSNNTGETRDKQKGSNDKYCVEKKFDNINNNNEQRKSNGILKMFSYFHTCVQFLFVFKPKKKN